jgi:hypothetical protein
MLAIVVRFPITTPLPEHQHVPEQLPMIAGDSEVLVPALAHGGGFEDSFLFQSPFIEQFVRPFP